MGHTDLAERLRLETRELHAEAERSGVMAALLHGRLDKAGYCALLRNLHEIYAALESALPQHAEHPMIVALRSPALLREAALASDLGLLHGADWRDEIPLAPAASGYADRLRLLAATGSSALVAHMYVRYLGDLHGGQILKRRVVYLLGTEAEVGACFYDFGGQEQTLALRRSFRAALAGLQPSGAEADAIVTEARWAFQQHQRLFGELQAAG